MEQRRYFEVRGEESDEWLVLDSKLNPPRVICRCLGWNAPKNAALIVAALEHHNSELYSKFAAGQQSTGAVSLAPVAPEPKQAGKSQAADRP